jgi:NitT/TauT family transport system substrate-binding protein
MAAQQGGLDPDKDLVFLDLGGSDKQLQALLAGSILGGAFSPPNSDVAIANGAKVLYNFTSQRLPYSGSNVIVTRDWAPKNEKTLVAFLRSMAEAQQLFRTKPEFVSGVYQKWGKVDKSVGDRAVELGVQIVPLEMLPRLDELKAVQDVVVNQNPAAAGVDTSQLFDDRYIKTLEREGLYSQLAK